MPARITSKEASDIDRTTAGQLTDQASQLGLKARCIIKDVGLVVGEIGSCTFRDGDQALRIIDSEAIVIVGSQLV